MLDEMPSLNELSEVLHMLPGGKSPGIDGLGVEVMTILWPVIKDSFYGAAAYFWESGDLPPAFKEGLLFLIPKSDNPSMLREWRPITLLNTIYKVMAKVFALRLAVVLPLIVPVNQQGFIKNRSPQNCILTFALVHEALKKRGRSAFFLALDQEKAYDKLQPDFLWELMDILEFSSACITRIKALQEHAETRILLNGDLLPSFHVEMGRFTLDIHEQSVLNLFRLLEDFQRAAGGKVNWLKSKLLVIGRYKQPPDWAKDLPIQVIKPDQSIRYLGASLATLWNGVDNGNLLLASLDRKAKRFTQDFMSFESRVVALKHGVYASLIYQLSVAKFKAGTVKKIEGVLRKFLWSVNREGQPKKSQVKWDYVTLPQKLGRLGVFRLREFQQALTCRATLKAMENPEQAIWPMIFTAEFLDIPPELFAVSLLYKPIPSQFKLSPVATLISQSWRRFASHLRWAPGEDINALPTNLTDCLFLLARRHVGVQEAGDFALKAAVVCENHSLYSLTDVLASLHFFNHASLGSLYGIMEAIFVDLRAFFPCDYSHTFVAQEWVLPGGKPLDLTWRGATVYKLFLAGAEDEQCNRMNVRWGLNWTSHEWRLVWRACEFRGLPHRHRYFIWRVLAKSFFVGRKQALMNLPGHSCDFCGVKVEDVAHAIFLCPRWDTFWQEVQRRIQGWGGSSNLRARPASLPEVLQWALSLPCSDRLFAIWMLALMWRLFWLERCTLKFQGKLNRLHLEKVVFLFLEELLARRILLKREIVRKYVSKVIDLVPVLPPRFRILTNDHTE
ncbi:hypothetical protein R1sor_017742 [Riccia sorocarpa]|uniref:Reverse transcriptase domain-containing protein n=1 Tax=Riccia sorocarpa TaxID=122646 RepID=A0ABD3I7P8_9MARC